MLRISLLLLALVCLALPARAQNAPSPAQTQTPAQAAPAQPQAPPAPTEAYRVRITNTRYGPVELSTDQGKTWLLVGRVTRPALAAAGGGTSKAEVCRSSEFGAALSLGDGRLIRIVPDAPQARHDQSAILVNDPVTAAFFKDFLPPVGSVVQELLNLKSEPIALPAGYNPHDDDVLLITVHETRLPADKIGAYAQDAATNYRDRTLSALRARGGHATSGTFTVIAKLPAGDVPSAVTFLVDGSVAAIMNRPPFAVQWNTNEWANGEHLVEARALNSAGVTVSLKKALVVVDNPK